MQKGISSIGGLQSNLYTWGSLNGAPIGALKKPHFTMSQPRSVQVQRVHADLPGTARPGGFEAGTVARVGRTRSGSSTDWIMKTARSLGAVLSIPLSSGSPLRSTVRHDNGVGTSPMRGSHSPSSIFAGAPPFGYNGGRSHSPVLFWRDVLPEGEMTTPLLTTKLYILPPSVRSWCRARA